jgi:hypothetical protein
MQKSKSTEKGPFVAFCETCGWYEGCETLEDGEILAQQHQDEKHEPMELTFYESDEWVN